MWKLITTIHVSSKIAQLNSFCERKCYSTTVLTAKRKYDLFSAVCLERHPVITKPLNDLQMKFSQYLNDLEFRNSLKNDYELKKEAEIKEADLIQKGLLQIDLDKSTSKSTFDIENDAAKELREFKLAPRITDEDNKNILDSLNRKLDKNLLLLVQQQINNVNYWIPPQCLRLEGETMRDTAERALRETCGDKVTVQFYSNAPIGVYKYVYPNAIKEKTNAYGAKIFYFLAKYCKGTISVDQKYQWLDRIEMKEALPPEIHDKISCFLIPE